jgi:dolichol kinase
MPFDRGLFLKELGRKAFHIASCVVPAAYHFLLPREWMLAALFLCIVGAGFLEYMRLTGRDLYPSPFMRPSEAASLAGYFYGAISLFLAVLLFSKPVAVAAMLFLILGDAITGLAGALYFMYTRQKSVDVRDGGSDELAYMLKHHKPVGLMLVMFLVCAAVGLLFYPAISYAAIVAGAAGAVIADAFPWRIGSYVIDDNLSIPLASGALMTLASVV